MAAWSDQDYRDDRLEDYGQHVGDNVYGDWSLDELITEINEAAEVAAVLIREADALVALLSVDDSTNERCEQGDDRPLTEAA